ncbi:MAG: TlpA disulfide reductase family protein [Flavobacteriaceae bacterium]|nr:TlpA disulfide reductase family protein [Flavobacteriaceae bacterium]
MKTSFSSEALAQKVYDAQGKEGDLGEVLERYRGKKVILEVWASWCSDCRKALPDVAKFQREHPEIPFVFLSVDEDKEAWKSALVTAMDRFDIKGEQYFFDTGWQKYSNNDFIDFIELDWVPRYMLLDENGNISVYYSKKILDKSIKEAL